MILRLPDSRSNYNLEMFVFGERGKPEYPEKNLSEQRREPIRNSTHIWRRRRDLNLGHIGGGERSHHCAIPCSPRDYLPTTEAISTFQSSFCVFFQLSFCFCFYGYKFIAEMLSTFLGVFARRNKNYNLQYMGKNSFQDYYCDRI